jgi:hypothetical protein
LDHLDAKILAILHKSPFKSSRPIGKRLPVARSTVLRHLHESLGPKPFHLHLDPYLLKGDLREERKEYARAILPFLHIAERDGWHHFMTDDES